MGPGKKKLKNRVHGLRTARIPNPDTCNIFSLLGLQKKVLMSFKVMAGQMAPKKTAQTNLLLSPVSNVAQGESQLAASCLAFLYG